jgi:hypothetical protein
MKYKTLTNLLYLWLQTETQIKKSEDFYIFIFLSLLIIEDLQNHFIFKFFILKFRFVMKIFQWKRSVN